MAVPRRRLLAALTALGTGVVGLVRTARGPAPRPRVAAGTVRTKERYGDHPRQVGQWWLPPGDPGSGLLPTVVLVHGGYWRAGYDRTLEDAIAADLAARGHLVWNVDYRPSTEPWPATLTDVALAFDHTANGSYADRVDRGRLAVVGHSAGGHLALWLASRHLVPTGEPGADPPLPPPSLVVAQAPVAGLAAGALLGLGGGAVPALLGGLPGDVPERYAVADPSALLPTGVPTVLVHADGDDRVPISQSEGYVRAAAGAGDDSRLVCFTGGHFEHLDPRSVAGAALREALETWAVR